MKRTRVLFIAGAMVCPVNAVSAQQDKKQKHLFEWHNNYGPASIRIEPIQTEGIGYVIHPYLFIRSKPYFPKWEESFEFAIGHYPVVVPEFSFGHWNPGTADNGGYGQEIFSYLENKRIGCYAGFLIRYGSPICSSCGISLS